MDRKKFLRREAVTGAGLTLPGGFSSLAGAADQNAGPDRWLHTDCPLKSLTSDNSADDKEYRSQEKIDRAAHSDARFTHGR